MQYISEIKKKDLKYVKYCGTKEDLFALGEGEVSLYDFSMANSCLEARIEAVTLVASTCYANPNAIGKDTLFNRLAQESLGLPSSSFEFIPVYLSTPQLNFILDRYDRNMGLKIPNIITYGEAVNGVWVTNYRALCADYDFLMGVGVNVEDFRLWYDDTLCQQVGKDYFKVFLSYIDTNTRAQYIRHRNASWQELSRRYVSGSKLDFEFYVSDNMSSIKTQYLFPGDRKMREIDYSQLLEIAKGFYEASIDKGIKAQDARRCLPQAMYTLVWSGWNPKGLKNFFNLRLDHHAQREIRLLAEAKQKLIEEYK